MLSGKVMSIHLRAGLIKITLIYKMGFFLEPYSNTEKNVCNKIWFKILI